MFRTSTVVATTFAGLLAVSCTAHHASAATVGEGCFPSHTTLLNFDAMPTSRPFVGDEFESLGVQITGGRIYQEGGNIQGNSDPLVLEGGARDGAISLTFTRPASHVGAYLNFDADCVVTVSLFGKDGQLIEKVATDDPALKFQPDREEGREGFLGLRTDAPIYRAEFVGTRDAWSMDDVRFTRAEYSKLYRPSSLSLRKSMALRRIRQIAGMLQAAELSGGEAAERIGEAIRWSSGAEPEWTGREAIDRVVVEELGKTYALEAAAWLRPTIKRFRSEIASRSAEENRREADSLMKSLLQAEEAGNKDRAGILALEIRLILAALDSTDELNLR